MFVILHRRISEHASQEYKGTEDLLCSLFSFVHCVRVYLVALRSCLTCRLAWVAPIQPPIQPARRSSESLDSLLVSSTLFLVDAKDVCL